MSVGTYSLCGHYIGEGLEDQAIIMECEQDTRGRYVYIQSGKIGQQLSLCEVQVYKFSELCTFLCFTKSILLYTADVW